MTEMTKKEAFTAVLAMAEVQENAVIAEIVEREIARLSRPKAPTKAQKENAIYVEALAAAMAPDTVYDYKAIVDLAPEFNEFTPPKVAALMKKLIEAGVVVKLDTKPVSYSLA